MMMNVDQPGWTCCSSETLLQSRPWVRHRFISDTKSGPADTFMVTATVPDMKYEDRICWNPLQ
jgi:hypothetical protein